MTKLTGKIGAAILAGTLFFGQLAALPAYAAADNIEIILTDVTEDNETTLKGEAKIMVSVKGAVGNVSVVQTALRFSGGLLYKSIDFLKGENNPPKCAFIPPNAALANDSGKLLPGFATNKEGRIPFAETEDLFILTFAGEAGDEVTVSLDGDGAGSLCVTDGITVEPLADAAASVTVKASAADNEGIPAKVNLVMNKVEDFLISNGEGYADSKITLRITNEKTGSTISTVLNTVADVKGGHMDSESKTPTFVVENTVVGNTTYTVEIQGPGYVTYKKTGVTFQDTLTVNNSEFRPGDINADGKVNAEDKAIFEAMKSGTATEYDKDFADFNRDGKVDKYDDVFEEIEIPEEVKKTAPEKMAKPAVTGGTKKITVSWTAPKDGGSAITGYEIRYGKNENSLTNTEEISGKNTTEKEISDLAQGTTYYVQIAAKNAIGTGAFSDIVSASTKKASTDDGGSGGGGGGSTGGSTGGSVGGSSTGSASQGGNVSANEPFTDLENHVWAKESVYTLKNKGIISGVSETMYAPGNPIKRGDFILILVRMLGVDNAFEDNFADVPEGSYYYDAIGHARAAGIATGDGINFMPENSITRQDLITLAYRAFLGLGYIEETEDLTVLDAFNDKGNIAAYAAAPMASMVAAGIIKGSDGNVNPLGNATRAEVAVMCARLLELMK